MSLDLILFTRRHFAPQGKFEIVSLSGSLRLSENNAEHNRTSSLYASLAGSDGRVFGGAVAGTLTAASTVQVLVSIGL